MPVGPVRGKEASRRKAGLAGSSRRPPPVGIPVCPGPGVQMADATRRCDARRSAGLLAGLIKRTILVYGTRGLELGCGPVGPYYNILGDRCQEKTSHRGVLEMPKPETLERNNETPSWLSPSIPVTESTPL